MQWESNLAAVWGQIATGGGGGGGEGGHATLQETMSVQQ